MPLDDVAAEMPKYKSHKTVSALKIHKIDPMPNGGAIFLPENTRFAPITLSPEYVKKHNPQSRGYYVVYADGYKSWSPAKTFEEGYSLVPNG